MSNIVKMPEELKPGTWYAIGVCNEFDEIEWSKAPILKFVSPRGRGEWVDANGGAVEFVRDETIDDDINAIDADAFMEVS